MAASGLNLILKERKTKFPTQVEKIPIWYLARKKVCELAPER